MDNTISKSTIDMELLHKASAEFNQIINKFCEEYEALCSKYQLKGSGVCVLYKHKERGLPVLGMNFNIDDFSKSKQEKNS